MGGVSARPAEGEVLSCADAAETKHTTAKQQVATTRFVFMPMLYQNFSGAGKWRRQEKGERGRSAYEPSPRGFFSLRSRAGVGAGGVPAVFWFARRSSTRLFRSP